MSFGTIGGLYNHSPPSTIRVSPVVYFEVARNTAACPISVALPMRPSGIPLPIISLTSSPDIPGASFVVPGVSLMGPGAMPTTRTLYGPHSKPRLRVRESTAAFAALACACQCVAGDCSVAEILMTRASLPVLSSFADCARAGNAAEDMLKVPRASIDMTVANPFGFRLLASARKFPAAPFTKISKRENVSSAYRIASRQAFGSLTSQTFHLHTLPVSRSNMAAERSRKFCRLPQITAALAP
mmetsp:Transcript_27150/g.59910  ORF Transcript_27150/g.59910 Transcript_27150/m.59910 type:complete len:242 (-) Transcript_27150:312-1037(-)